MELIIDARYHFYFNTIGRSYECDGVVTGIESYTEACDEEVAWFMPGDGFDIPNDWNKNLVGTSFACAARYLTLIESTMNVDVQALL